MGTLPALSAAAACLALPEGLDPHHVLLRQTLKYRCLGLLRVRIVVFGAL